MVCAAGPRCSPRYRVLSRPGNGDYRGSLRPRSRNEHRTPAMSNIAPNPLEELGDQLRRARGAIGLNRSVVDLAPDLVGDRGGDLGRAVGLEVHAAAGPVAREPVTHVEVLLEVVAEREVEEGASIRG